MFVLMVNGSHIDHFIVREAVITAGKAWVVKQAVKFTLRRSTLYRDRSKRLNETNDSHTTTLKSTKIPYNIDHGKKIAVLPSTIFSTI